MARPGPPLAVCVRSVRGTITAVPATPTPSAFGPLQSWLHSSAFHLGVETLAGALAVLWAATAIRVHRDARRRLGSRWLVAIATLLGLVPFVGAALWLLLRPPEPRAEALQRELEIRAFELSLTPRP